MNGFEIFLCVIAAIIGLFVLILSVPVHISVGYDDKIRVSIRYLFIKLNILPAAEKKKKEKKPKKESEKKEKPKKESEAKEKKPNPILEMVRANGQDGMMVVIRNLGRIMGLYGGKLSRSVVFDEIVLHICVGTGDSAATAIKYGQICQKVFPVLGYICSNNIVKRYDIDVHPDFLANKTESEFYMDFHVCVRKITNASIGMVVRLVFGVVLKFLSGAKKNKAPKENNMEQKKA